MKKLIVLFILFLSIQVFAQKGFHLGIMGGHQLSAQLNKQDFDNPDVKYGGLTSSGAGGVTFNYHFTDKIGLGLQLLFAGQGLKYLDPSVTMYFRKTNYIKLPILFHVNSPSDKLVGGYFYIGPQFSFLVGKDWVADGVSLKNNDELLDQSYSAYAAKNSTFTFGAAMGFGIVFNILDGKLLVNAGIRLDGDFISAYKELKSDQLLNGKYAEFDNTPGLGIFATSPETGKRSPTHNVGFLSEVGIRYVFMKK